MCSFLIPKYSKSTSPMMKTHASVKVLFSCGFFWQDGLEKWAPIVDCAGRRWTLHWTHLGEMSGLEHPWEPHEAMLWLLLFLLVWCSCCSYNKAEEQRVFVLVVLVVISSRTCNKAEEQRGKQKSEKAEKAENQKIKRSEAKQKLKRAEKQRSQKAETTKHREAKKPKSREAQKWKSREVEK